MDCPWSLLSKTLNLLADNTMKWLNPILFPRINSLPNALCTGRGKQIENRTLITGVALKRELTTVGIFTNIKILNFVYFFLSIRKM